VLARRLRQGMPSIAGFENHASYHMANVKLYIRPEPERWGEFRGFGPGWPRRTGDRLRLLPGLQDQPKEAVVWSRSLDHSLAITSPTKPYRRSAESLGQRLDTSRRDRAGSRGLGRSTNNTWLCGRGASTLDACEAAPRNRKAKRKPPAGATCTGLDIPGGASRAGGLHPGGTMRSGGPRGPEDLRRSVSSVAASGERRRRSCGRGRIGAEPFDMVRRRRAKICLPVHFFFEGDPYLVFHSFTRSEVEVAAAFGIGA